MNSIKKNSFNEFNKAAKAYDFYAFNKSLGLGYLSYLETLFIQKYVKETKNGQFLDLGIGTGRISRILLEKKIDVKALDFSSEMIKLSQQNLSRYVKKGQLHVYQGDLNKKLSFQDKTFDGVLCIRVIKYVKNWKQTIDEINRVIKPNGIFIIEYPNFYSVQTLSQFYAGYSTFKPSEFNRYLTKSGFKILHTMHGTKLPFYIYKFSNSKTQLKNIMKIEKFLQRYLKEFLSRNILLYCQKIDKNKKNKQK